MATSFRDFALLCDNLRSTTKRNEKKHLIAEFLKRLDSDELAPAVNFLTGKALPETDSRALELGGSTLWKLRPSRQLSLVNEPLTIGEVSSVFETIAGTLGQGSRAKRESLIAALLGRADHMESRYLFHILAGEMRIGAVEGVVMEAIAESSQTDLKLIQRANMLAGNLGEVAKAAMAEGEAWIRRIGIRLFAPIKPMLAGLSYSLADILKYSGGKVALEWKFDGARIQAHKKGDRIKIFSRRLGDVTESIPDVVSSIRSIDANELLVEGEAVAIGPNGKPLPFQDLMRRFVRVKNIGEVSRQVPLRLFLFDILYLNGEMLIDEPYERRWDLLSKTAPDFLAPRIITEKVEEAETFLQSALKAGHEGLMAKSLKSPYAPGSRGKNWIKIKPFETLDLAIIAAEWGYGRREGWLSNYHLGARDEKTGGYAMLGKTFKGLNDEEFETITKRLLAAKVRESRQTVYVKPEIVVEVAYNEIQRSPRYQSGLALRFARINRMREDKSVDEVDTLEKVKGLYGKQFEAKANFSTRNKMKW
jgi:DNA ligase-1